MRYYDCLIVGSGHGGSQAAQSLRQHNFAGSIALLGEESDPPYHRPPLSKEYLEGDRDFESILIRPRDFWESRNVTMLLGNRVEKIDPVRRHVTCANGAVYGYSRLVWAAGGKPRNVSCPGTDLAGVHTVRTRADVDSITANLRQTERVAIIGGGYIGLETAAVLSKLGKRVTILEAMDRVLARVAGSLLSKFYETEHRAHGVDIQLGVRIERLEGSAGRVSGVLLSNGRIVPAQLVIVGIGIVPSVEPLIAAGAAGTDGVDVDQFCRTTLPEVYAVGDCARHVNEYAAGSAVRLESVQNATQQALVAAKAIAGQPVPYKVVPTFWSKQYDLRLQTAGLSIGHDQTILRGDLGKRQFAIVYLRRGRVIALDCINTPKDYLKGQALIAKDPSPSVDPLADLKVALD